MRIALIEDNKGLARGIAYRLNDLGHSVDVLGDGLEAETHLRDDGAEMIILDINLPRLDGLSVLRGLRERGDDRPVLLLTARSETVDRVRGLDAGADDYLVKPFEMDELEARLRALARHQAKPFRREQRFAALAFDLDTREVTVGQTALPLPRREVALVEALIAAQGRTVSKADLLEHVYGIGTDVEEGAVEAHLSRLRKRLKPHGIGIRVQRGLGYALADLSIT